MRKFCFLILALSFAAGCTTPDTKSFLADHDGLISKLANSDGSITKLRREKQIETCNGYGFKSGTEAFSNCIMHEEQNRKTMAAIRSVNKPQQSKDVLFSPSVHCTSSKIGHVVATDCQ